MATWRTIAEDAYRLINVVAIDQPLQSDHLITATKALATMLDDWTRRGVRPDGVNIYTATLPGGKCQFSLTGERPVNIQAMTYLQSESTEISTGYSGVILFKEWSHCLHESRIEGMPEGFAYFLESDRIVVQLDRTTRHDLELMIHGHPAFEAVEDLNTEVSFQPGYLSAVKYRLAMELGIYYPPIDSIVIMEAKRREALLFPVLGQNRKQRIVKGAQDYLEFGRLNRGY